jgi:hypothetical protein
MLTAKLIEIQLGRAAGYNNEGWEAQRLRCDDWR